MTICSFCDSGVSEERARNYPGVGVLCDLCAQLPPSALEFMDDETAPQPVIDMKDLIYDLNMEIENWGTKE